MADRHGKDPLKYQLEEEGCLNRKNEKRKKEERTEMKEREKRERERTRPHEE